MQNPATRLGRPGDAHVTGTIAGLAVSSHAYVNFDLGPAWDLFSQVQIILCPVAPMTALNTVTVYGAEAPYSTAADVVPSRILGIPGAAVPSQAKFTNLAPATGAQAVWVRPAGRFIVVDFFNQDPTNAAGPTSAITFAAYPGA